MFSETVAGYFLVEVSVGLFKLLKQVLKLGVALLLVFQNVGQDLHNLPPLGCFSYYAC